MRPVHRAARRPFGAEAGAPVLVQVPRRGYVPSLACGRCRTIARCRHCTGPLSLPEPGARARSAAGVGGRNRRCGDARCGSDAARAVVVEPAYRRRARPRIPGNAGRHLGGRSHRADVAARRPWWSPRRGPNPAPRADTGRRCCWIPGCCWACQDLRVAEDAPVALNQRGRIRPCPRRRGVVTVIAEASIPTVQSLIRWDPVGHAEAELAARTEVGLPPACISPLSTVPPKP